MFERFTDRARRVVVLAQEEAYEVGHGYIGTEHILAGLLHEEDGVAAQVLRRLGLTPESVHQQIIDLVGEGVHPRSGHIPFTPRVKKVFELALREALQLGHSYIGTEHILLGLVLLSDGVAAQVWVRLHVEAAQIKPLVIELLSQQPLPAADPNPKLDEVGELIRKHNQGEDAPSEPSTHRFIPCATFDPELQRQARSGPTPEDDPIHTLAFQGSNTEVEEVARALKQRFGRSHLGSRLANALLEQIS